MCPQMYFRILWNSRRRYRQIPGPLHPHRRWCRNLPQFPHWHHLPCYLRHFLQILRCFPRSPLRRRRRRLRLRFPRHPRFHLSVPQRFPRLLLLGCCPLRQPGSYRLPLLQNLSPHPLPASLRELLLLSLPALSPSPSSLPPAPPSWSAAHPGTALPPPEGHRQGPGSPPLFLSLEGNGNQ